MENKIKLREGGIYIISDQVGDRGYGKFKILEITEFTYLIKDLDRLEPFRVSKSDYMSFYVTLEDLNVEDDNVVNITNNVKINYIN